MCEVTVVVQKLRHGTAKPLSTTITTTPEFQNLEKLCKFFGSLFQPVELKDEKRNEKKLQFTVTAMSARSVRQTSLFAFGPVANNTKINVKVNSHTFKKAISKLHILYIF